MSDPTTIRKSVTRDDYAGNPYGGGMVFVYPTSYGGPAYAPLPPWWSPGRDFVLRGTIYRESMWADAVFKAITKTAALGWEIKDSEVSGVRTKRGQRIYLTALAGMHRGWVPFMAMHLRDYLLTDNGAFVEIIRASSAAGSRILGLAHLDGARCTRTGDPDIPVLYRDRLGSWHEMRWWQIMTFADMPDPSETWNGVGFCAASRAFLTIAKQAALEQYIYEKASGDGATEMDIIRGLSPESLQSAIVTADATQKRRGAVYFKGKIITTVMGDMPLEKLNIPLKNVPDGFNAKEERDNTYLIYANALGIPVQDIQPLSGQGLGTGTQTVILAEDAEGQGLAAWRQQWIHANNEYILPESTTFAWANKNDTRDQKAQAEVKNLQADAIMKLIGSPTAPGVISQAQGLNLAADWNTVPREFVPKGGDATPGGALSDEEKPVDISQVMAALPQLAQAAAPVLPAVTKTEKAAGHTGVMVALYPDGAAAKALAAQSGVTEPIEGLHLTLAFLGDSSEANLATNKARLVAAVKQWAAEHGQRLKGTINGLGRFFHSEDDGTNAVFVSPDVPGLTEMRQSLVSWIEQSGFDYSQDHGFTPHITVAYVPLDAPTPPIRVETPVSFGQVTLAWGDERYDYPLGQRGAVKDARSEALIDEQLDAALALVSRVLAKEAQVEKVHKTWDIGKGAGKLEAITIERKTEAEVKE